MGLNPAWFGIIVVIAVVLALITPPMGITVFVTRGLATDVSLARVFPGVFAFCAALVALTAFVVAAPESVTVLPTIGR